MKLIPLTQGQFAKVDDEDFARFGHLTWHAHLDGGIFYARKGLKKSPWCIRLHQVIMNAPKGSLVDHINHDGLDCRKENLRICTRSQNAQNQKGPHKDSKSGIRGVFWSKRDRKWRSEIQIGRKRIYLGRFSDMSQAALAYAEANLKYFGEFGGRLC